MKSKKTLIFLFLPLMALISALPWYIFVSYFLRAPVIKTWDISTQPIFQKSEVNFLAMGDIMLSRSVAGKIQKAGDPLLPFGKISNVLESVDFSFANLETPIMPTKNIWAPGSLVFSTPESYAVGLQKYNFSVLNLANNHAYDQGKQGLFYTMEYLQKLWIQYVWAGQNLEEAWKPVIQEKNGIKTCFIGASYASVNDNGTTQTPYVARTYDIARLQQSVTTAKNLCHFVVVTMHAGQEYKREPNQFQKEFARAAVDAGADIVIGAHPHWIQTIERYCPNSDWEVTTTCEQPRYIFYSLGNFIFDQEWSQDTKEGLMLAISFSGNSSTMSWEIPLERLSDKNISIELKPVIIENYSTPRLANEQEIVSILAKIGETSVILK